MRQTIQNTPHGLVSPGALKIIQATPHDLEVIHHPEQDIPGLSKVWPEAWWKWICPSAWVYKTSIEYNVLICYIIYTSSCWNIQNSTRGTCCQQKAANKYHPEVKHIKWSCLAAELRFEMLIHTYKYNQIHTTTQSFTHNDSLSICAHPRNISMYT